MDVVYIIVDFLASLLRFIGLAAFGVAFGWLALDLLKKSQLWQVQMTIFLGFAGLLIALAVFIPAGGLGAFAGGAGVAILVWGLPKKEKKDELKD